MVTIDEKTPLISWTYGDPSGQPQEKFRVIVRRGPEFNEEILWDTGLIAGTQTQVRYGFDGNAKALPPHETLQLIIQASDGQDTGTSEVKEFVLSSKPEILIVTVDNRLNPINLQSTQQPVFRWQYEDIEEDALISYEIRVGDSSIDLGTDAFPGNIWRTEERIRPNPHESTFDDDESAFPGCIFPKALIAGVTYFFQLRVSDDNDVSDWATGFFRLNNAPSAENLQILPVTPFGNDDLEATFDFIDDEPEGARTEIKWYKDNVELVELRNSKIIPGSQVKSGDNWFFTVRPHDGIEFGELVVSPRVGVLNDPPLVSILGIDPSLPKGGETLEAKFVVADKNQDEVTLKVRWFRNEIEQPALRNSLTVPSSFTEVGDEWFFEMQGDDGVAESQIKRSLPVTIGNSRPRIGLLQVNGGLAPTGIEGQSPTVSWIFDDFDGQSQAAYQVMIGTKPPRTDKPTLDGSGFLPPSADVNGIILVLEDSDGTQGNDVLDTGIIQSSQEFHQRQGVDSRVPFPMGPVNSTRYVNYTLDNDLITTVLPPGPNDGEAFFEFPGDTGTYELTLEFVGEEGRQSTYRLVVDGIAIDEFTSEPRAGLRTKAFKSTRVLKGSQVSIVGVSASSLGRAPFRRIISTPVLSFEIPATQLDLSGYEDAGDGTVGLVGSTGFARAGFPFASGKYDVEIHYVTETTGNPTASFQKNGSELDGWTFESGSRERIRLVEDVDLSTGDLLRVFSTRDGGASAKIAKLVFVPLLSGGTTRLLPGFTYFASVRVNDGSEWSPWNITRFTMSGSSWNELVDNEAGWTLEVSARVFPVSQDVGN
jgi:hypothetical protein